MTLAFAMMGMGCLKSPQKRLVGSWGTTDHRGETGGFVFNADGSATMTIDGEVLDGPSVGGSMTWSLDSRPDPMHLDLVVTARDGSVRTLRMIAKFSGDDELQIRWSGGGSRPAAFAQTAKEVESSQLNLLRK